MFSCYVVYVREQRGMTSNYRVQNKKQEEKIQHNVPLFMYLVHSEKIKEMYGLLSEHCLNITCS